jgi:hypothetical protein
MMYRLPYNPGHRARSRCGRWGNGDNRTAAGRLERLDARQDKVVVEHGLVGWRRQVERAVFERE